MRDMDKLTERLICAASQAKKLADEIDLLDGISPHDESLFIALRKSISSPALLPDTMLREVLEHGFRTFRGLKVAELQSLLSGVYGDPITAVVDPRKGEGPS
jgi:hypothetical protein